MNLNKCNSKYKMTWIKNGLIFINNNMCRERNRVMFLEMCVVINKKIFYHILVLIS
jgi:hypothetical protein